MRPCESAGYAEWLRQAMLSLVPRLWLWIVYSRVGNATICDVANAKEDSNSTFDRNITCLDGALTLLDCPVLHCDPFVCCRALFRGRATEARLAAMAYWQFAAGKLRFAMASWHWPISLRGRNSEFAGSSLKSTRHLPIVFYVSQHLVRSLD
ncbi:hypothetical protein BCEP4_220104 [Burkholderia cepacia]|nr:hypothetical protein BCEP4_220104 [Burkholderia cepacia]